MEGNQRLHSDDNYMRPDNGTVMIREEGMSGGNIECHKALEKNVTEGFVFNSKRDGFSRAAGNHEDQVGPMLGGPFLAQLKSKKKGKGHAYVVPVKEPILANEEFGMCLNVKKELAKGPIDMGSGMAQMEDPGLIQLKGDPEQRHYGWILLRRLRDLSRLPWFCAGDFNEILHDNEKHGGLMRPHRLMNDFKERGEGSGKRGHRFHFESCWAERVECRELVDRSWDVANGENEVDRVVLEIQNCTKQLGGIKRSELDCTMRFRDMEQIIVEYFRNLFTLTVSHDVEVAQVLDSVQSRLLQLSCDVLDVPFSEWSEMFLAKMMVKLGFSDNWIGRVMNYVTMISYSFLLNGVACNNLRPTRAIHDILDVYHMASGQRVNFNKSSICVSKSVFKREADRLTGVLCIRLVHCHDRYLGLPGFAGRNKRELFNNLKDRIWKKVRGWNGKLLSTGGKEGRGLIDASSRWRVSDGNKICIFDNKWIPYPVSFKIISPNVRDDIVHVSQLRAVSGSWNAQLIHEIFLEDDVREILAIPSSVNQSKDILCWHYTSDGNYIVKSGYKLGVFLDDTHYPGSSGSSSDGCWSSLWRLKIMLKVKVFIWRTCKQWLPTMAGLASRHIHVEDVFHVCLKEHGSIL
ncbi:hypothetical protein Dsin_012134 [Dipteronia sinensis]|uniref:Reverse transcriptase n=1 Tax=Dipteronia sinensis TaxID=43782 RepID=A0AAE0AIS5_9ROSI|nr:hypothetical protein Dsin_012134 [Dipteronia sinensis]